FVTDSRARIVIASEPLAEKIAPAVAAASAPPKLVVHGRDFEAFTDGAAPMPEAHAVTCDDVAFWLYSSGSTGRPKGVVHLHAHLLHTAELYGQGVLGVRADDVVFSAAKLFFAYGLGNAMTFPLHVGASAVLLRDRPTPASTMRVFERYAPTIFCG